MEQQQGTVVDLARYRAERARRALPLFDAPAPSPVRPHAVPRPLSDREAGHRRRMLRHLRAVSR
jgi:hypothetical protein